VAKPERSFFLFCFCQGFNAFRAQGLANLHTVLEDGNLLQIGFELPIRGPHGKTAVMPEHGGFSTIFALSHKMILSFSFNTLIITKK
jgi:hypothetical protein